MSTDPSLPEPGNETAVPSADDGHIRALPEIKLPRDTIEEIDEVIPAEEADADEDLRLRRPKPALPHPGFWWAVGWCLLLIIVAEILIPLPIVIVIAVVQMIRLGGVQEGLQWLLTALGEPTLLLPLQEL